ncbi:M24 family metallopeptidase [Bradyrhizobium zhanjiangense]|uniref:Aminopeptidase P family protein n=1 Tax=Bradyrhizobium zhanjiangense TaxID=1325107 RepID=A0A4Q0Q424_9BRAD|nr:Xaa-Pro peptidase family protein [Bradyrhizobium zhanjiangense]RXG83575.1 aminopeptidase P family protein [Bradyrhizobium zhanjiangense]
MSKIGRLSGNSTDIDWEFSGPEYRRRVEKARKLMRNAGMSCMLLTGDKNVRYMAGESSTLLTISNARPRYVILPLEKEPIAVWPSVFVMGLQRRSWISDIRSWPSPRPGDEGVTLVIEALRECLTSGDRVGVEIGPESRLGMSFNDFIRIRDELAPTEFVDAGRLMQTLRMVKSTEEVERMRRACSIVGEAFEWLPNVLRPGISEYDVHDVLNRKILELGAGTVDYLVPTSGSDTYDQCTTGPSRRVLGKGDVLYVDVGATWRGYFCDCNRNWAIGRPSQEVADAYRRAYDATQIAIDSLKPGQTAADLYRTLARAANRGMVGDPPSGRMGHGVGMEITEPPSLSTQDQTVLEPGMVLAIEPGLYLPDSKEGHRRRMLHEENVVVTEDGCELLTRRASPTLIEV